MQLSGSSFPPIGVNPIMCIESMRFRGWVGVWYLNETSFSIPIEQNNKLVDVLINFFTWEEKAIWEEREKDIWKELKYPATINYVCIA